MLRPILAKSGLSNRESEVAALVATGLSNKEVADKLFVTEKTIKFHLTNIYKKMSIRSRAQLIVWCLPHMRFEESGGTGSEAPAQPIVNQQANQGAIIQPAGAEVAREGETAGRNRMVDGITTLTPGQYNPDPNIGSNRGSDVGSGAGGGAFGV